jgi:ABC-type branched-subunit amino acid transport system substrate-binding protein
MAGHSRRLAGRLVICALVAALASIGIGGVVTSAGAATSTAKVKIMVITDFTSPIGFAAPEAVPSVKAALKGVPNVEIESCDSKGDATAGQACTQKAIDEGVVAVVLGFGQGVDDLQKAGIPILGNTDTTATNSFPAASSFALYAANGVALAKSGCKKMGILYLDGTDFLVNYVQQGAESAGAKEVARAAIPMNTPDLSPAVGKLIDAGSQCIALSVAPNQVVQAVTAINQTGKKLQMAAVSAILTKEVRDGLGDLANGILIVDNTLNAEDPSPAIKKVTKQIHAVDSSADVTQVGVISYVAAKVLAAGLAQVQGDVTAASLMTALNALRDVPTGGLTLPYSAIPLTNPTFVRFFNHYGISYKIVKGKPKAQTKFFDLSPILEGTKPPATTTTTTKKK